MRKLLPILVLAFLLPSQFVARRLPAKKHPAVDIAKLLAARPVEFLENKGQLLDMNGNSASMVLFKAEAPGVDLYVTKTGLKYVFLKVDEDEDEAAEEREKEMNRSLNPLKNGPKEEAKITYECIELELVGAHIDASNIIKEDSGFAYFNFIAGAKRKSMFGVRKYKRITVKDIYPGIDWVLYNAGSDGFKYDFVVHPGADPSLIAMLYRSRKPLKPGENGSITIAQRLGVLTEQAPVSYMARTGAKVASRFNVGVSEKKKGLHHCLVTFYFPGINVKDLKDDLVIDPLLKWATFFGGTNIEGTTTLDVDGAGNIISCGYGGTGTFPLLSAGTYFQSSASNGFILKFANDGTLLWSTYYEPVTNLLDVKFDINNRIFLLGTTTSTALPVLNAGTFFQPALGGQNDVFIAKFDNLGNPMWCTYFGGSSGESAVALTTDLNGNVFLSGYGSSLNLPLLNAGTYFEGTPGPQGSGFIAKFTNAGTLQWCTYVKGTYGASMCTDKAGNLFVAGYTNTLIPLMNPGGGAFYQPALGGGTDTYILKFDNAGNQLYGTYFGGNAIDWSTSCVADKSGCVFVYGYTQSTNLPLHNAGTFFQGNIAASNTADLFLLKLSPACLMLWSTYFGGTRADQLTNLDNIAADTCGNIYIACSSNSRNLPFKVACDSGYFDNAMDTSVANSLPTNYLAQFSNNGTLTWSTYMGGDSWSFRHSLACDKAGNLFVTGEWGGANSNPNSYPIKSESATSFTSVFSGGDDIFFGKFFFNPLPASMSFTYGAYCTSDTAHLPAKGPGFQSGSTFSSTPGLSINPLTGQVVPAASTPGTYTVSYIAPSCNCLGSGALLAGTSTVSIMQAPQLSIVGNTFACKGQKATYTASGAANYSWTNGPVSPTYTLIVGNATSYVFTVTGNSGNTCNATATIKLTVSACNDISEIDVPGVTLFPNPNTGDFTINAPVDQKFTITNELGQVIEVVELSARNDRKVKVRGLVQGVYFLRSQTGSAAFKIVVTE